MELFKAHEGDVVVWVIHNGQTCSRNAGCIQFGAMRAKQSQKVFQCNTAALHLHEVISQVA